MARRGNGYNNPAFCNQFDASLYDYEYVAEIDPDSPDLRTSSSYQHSKQVPPRSMVFDNELCKADNFDDSDESNGSIIVEECNNRRITLICDKRQTVDEGLMKTNENASFNQRQRFVDGNHQQYRARNDFPHSPRDQFMRYIEDAPARGRIHRYEELEGGLEDSSIGSHKEKPRQHRYAEIDELEAEGVHFIKKKPRAPSPVTITQKTPTERISHARHNRFDDPFRSLGFSTSPSSCHDDSFELSDFSPTANSPSQRQPPLGASAAFLSCSPHESGNRHKVHASTPRCSTDDRSGYFVYEKRPLVHSPINPVPVVSGSESRSARRNIASSFTVTPDQTQSPSQRRLSRRNTAVITPILQRKLTTHHADSKTDFTGMTRKCLSTYNVNKDGAKQKFDPIPRGINNSANLKRNKSVPAFGKHFADDSDAFDAQIAHATNYNQSPTKSPDNYKNITRSRMSLLDDMKNWSESETQIRLPYSACIIFIATIQLLAGIVNCTIAFYLMSRLGRRYYLDLGILGGFSSIVLGGLGFRAKYWRWLPNRNYVSGYLVLAGFSIISCCAFTLIITVRPMAGSPTLDMAAGAICGISVLIILLALTGLTMSGCCKIPPPDNRVSAA